MHAPSSSHSFAMMRMNAPWLHWPQTQALIAAFGDEPLRFVGGCVRDAALSRPVQDVDAATPMLPHDVMRLLAQAGIRAIPTGIDHGTVTAVVDKTPFQITTLRRDVATDGRRATIAYTDNWEADASRRDFTMNALYCDAQGVVTDYFGGAEDARAGRIRFIGDAHERIREDALRILRFFRFFAHYGKDPVDEAGLMACAQAAPAIDGLSGERISAEMLKLLAAPRAYEAVGIMQHCALWPRVVPQAVDPTTLAALPAALRKAGRDADALLALACLLRSIPPLSRPGEGGGLISTIAARWKLSKAQVKRLRLLCSPVAGEGRVGDEKEWKKRIRAWGKDLFTDRAILAIAEGAEESSVLAALALARVWQPPAFPVTGDDLTAHGIRPGREMGRLLRKMEAQWEESGYAMDKKALLETVT